MTNSQDEPEASRRRVTLPKFEVSDAPDTYTRLEVKAARARDRVRQDLGNLDFANEVRARKKYSWRVYKLVLGWLTFVGLVVLLEGFNSLTVQSLPTIFTYDFSLSTEVLIALITSATASVIGLFTIIVRYFFSRPSDRRSDDNEST